ncbi:MAG: hypothetical protein P1V97_17120, partial [Planctomycetota bacterium]|nr:hypothetical protein [Planctomycetota bacterium]
FAPLVSALLICGIGFVLSYESFDPGFTETKNYVFGESEKRPVLKDGEDGGAGKRDNEMKKG